MQEEINAAVSMVAPTERRPSAPNNPGKSPSQRRATSQRATRDTQGGIFEFGFDRLIV
jgi:hypothetical protein